MSSANVYNRLGYNFTPSNTDVLITFSNNTVSMLNSIPTFLDDWQYTDIGNSDTTITNYLKNPVAITVNTIVQICTQIYANSNLASSLTAITSNAANVAGYVTTDDPPVTVEGSGNKFYNHTNRLSGLNEITSSTATLPHYDTAMGVGKAITYITYQSDDIQNNSPILGNFTSILVNDDLQAKKNVIATYPQQIANSLTPDGMGGYTSSLTAGQISAISSNVASIHTLFETRRTSDETFYTNSQNILKDLQKLRKFNNLGQTELYLFRNYIGTDRLIANISPPSIANTAVIT